MNTTVLLSPSVHPVPQLPLAAITTFAGFRDLLSSGLGVIVLISFIAAVVLFFTGIFMRDRDPGIAQKCFFSAFLCGIAVAVVSVFFFLGGQGGAVVDAKFN